MVVRIGFSYVFLSSLVKVLPNTPISLALVERLHFTKDSAATVSCALFDDLLKKI